MNENVSVVIAAITKKRIWNCEMRNSRISFNSLISLQQRCLILDGKTLFSLRLRGAKGMAHSVDTTRGSGVLIFLSLREHGDRHLTEPVPSVTTVIASPERVATLLAMTGYGVRRAA